MLASEHQVRYHILWPTKFGLMFASENPVRKRQDPVDPALIIFSNHAGLLTCRLGNQLYYVRKWFNTL